MSLFTLALTALSEIPGIYKAWLERDRAKMDMEVKLQTERLYHEVDELKDQIIVLADNPSPNNELRIESLNGRIVRKLELIRSIRSANGDAKGGNQIPVR